MTIPDLDEDTIQIQAANFLRLALPDSVGLWFHPANGGKRAHKIGANGKRYSPEAQKLKAMGVRPGVSDFVFAIPEPGRSRPFMAVIELKTRTGRLNADQVDFRDLCHALGIPWALCRTVVEVYDALIGWGVPLRGARPF